MNLGLAMSLAMDGGMSFLNNDKSMIHGGGEWGVNQTLLKFKTSVLWKSVLRKSKAVTHHWSGAVKQQEEARMD